MKNYYSETLWERPSWRKSKKSRDLGDGEGPARSLKIPFFCSSFLFSVWGPLQRVSKYSLFVFLNLFCWFSRVLAMFLAFSVRPFPTAWPFGVTRREEHIEEAVGGSSWGVCDHTYVYIILPGRALATLAQVAARPTQEAESVHDTRHSGNCCRGSRPAFGPSLWPQVIMMQPCATRSINQSG